MSHEKARYDVKSVQLTELSPYYKTDTASFKRTKLFGND